MGSIKFFSIKLNSLFFSFLFLFKNTYSARLLPFRLPFFIFERFSTQGRRKWQQFHQVVPSSPPMTTIEVSDLVHALRPNAYKYYFFFLLYFLACDPALQKAPFTSWISLSFFRAPWICLQQQFLWKCRVHGRSHSPPPRYPEVFLSVYFALFFVHYSHLTNILHQTGSN